VAPHGADDRPDDRPMRRAAELARRVLTTRA